MSDEEAIGAVGPDRRTFVRRLVVGAVFAAPVVSSFTMSGVDAIFGTGAGATTTTVGPNTTPPPAPPHYPTDVNCFFVSSGLDVQVTDGANTLHLTVPSGALPDATSVCIYRADLSSLTTIVPPGQTPVRNVPGGGHPDATSAITLTVHDPSVAGGDKIFVLNGGTAVQTSMATPGLWVVVFTTDPSYVVTHAAAAAAVGGTPEVTG